MTDERIRAEELERLRLRAQAAFRELCDSDTRPLRTILREVEGAVVRAAIERHRTIVHTAAALGIARNTLSAMLIEHNIRERP